MGELFRFGPGFAKSGVDARALMATVPQSELSSLEIAERVTRLVEDNHFRGCPWEIGVQLRNPDRIAWDQVSRAVRP